MIAKSDIFILFVASALLVFTLMRSTLFTAPDAPLVQYQRPSGQNNSGQNNSGQTNNTTSTATNLTVNSRNSTEQTEQIGQSGTPIGAGDVVAQSDGNTTVTTGADDNFQEPEIIREAAFKTHVVESGEYLSLLAQRYNTTVATLRELNNLTGSTIYVGQTLVYPDP